MKKRRARDLHPNDSTAYTDAKSGLAVANRSHRPHLVRMGKK